MEIYSFTGKSGTGKSYSAARICREKHIDAIIDDGLLIYRGGIAAGSPHVHRRFYDGRTAKGGRRTSDAGRRACHSGTDGSIET